MPYAETPTMMEPFLTKQPKDGSVFGWADWLLSSSDPIYGGAVASATTKEKGETMGLFSGIGKILKGAFNVAKTVAPAVLPNLIPGGGIISAVVGGALDAKRVGKAVGIAPKASVVDDIIDATTRTRSPVSGYAQKTMEAASGIRVKPGVGKVLLSGAAAGMGTAGGIVLAEAAADRLAERFGWRKSVGKLPNVSIPVGDIGPLIVEGTERYYNEMATLSKRRPKPKRRRKTSRTRRSSSSRKPTKKGKRRKITAAQLKRLRAGWKKWRARKAA